MTRSSIEDYVEANFDRFISELQSLCRIPGVVGSDDMTAAAAAVAERLMALGAEVSVIPTGGAPVVLASVGSGDRTLLVYDHYDVQPPEPLAEWDCDPYAAVIRNGALISRGVADNRGNLLARVHAVESLLSVSGLPLRVAFVVEGEEEIGSPNLPKFVRNHREILQADGCLWEAGDIDERGRLNLYLGGKGICYLDLQLVDDRPDLHSGHAAVVRNPLWRLVWALNTIRADDDRILVDGFYDRVRPPNDLERQLAGQVDLDPGLPRDQMIVTDPQQQACRLMFEPTATICGLDGGYRGPGSKTVLPARAAAKLDFRLVPDQDPDEIEQLVRDHLRRHGFGDIVVTPHGHLPPARTDPRSAVVSAARDAARAVYGTEPVVVPSMAGSGPLWLFIDVLGIPTVGFGVGHQGSRTHGPNENIRLDDYRRGIVMAARFMKEFAGE